MQIRSLNSKIIFSSDTPSALSKVIQEEHPQLDGVFVLVDSNTRAQCLPLLGELSFGGQQAKVVEVEAGEANKSIESCEKIWAFLTHNGATRKSLLINVGGGMVCDLGGFAAGVFKRGIPFINVPTTLLAQVDASVGGKLAVNFQNFKNEIGLFQSPLAVVVDMVFLRTLDDENLLSGFAEMLKHALIFGKEHWQQLNKFDVLGKNWNLLQKHISKSVFIKNDYVTQDPTEKGIRKALNFGHTFGHAIETLSHLRGQPMLHGRAIAEGMVLELILSHRKKFMPKAEMEQVIQKLLKTFGFTFFQQEDLDQLLELMTHDKKNSHQQINFTLLEEIGEVAIDQHCTMPQLVEAFQMYQAMASEANA